MGKQNRSELCIRVADNEHNNLFRYEEIIQANCETAVANIYFQNQTHPKRHTIHIDIQSRHIKQIPK